MDTFINFDKSNYEGPQDLYRPASKQYNMRVPPVVDYKQVEFQFDKFNAIEFDNKIDTLGDIELHIKVKDLPNNTDVYLLIDKVYFDYNFMGNPFDEYSGKSLKALNLINKDTYLVTTENDITTVVFKLNMEHTNASYGRFLPLFLLGNNLRFLLRVTLNPDYKIIDKKCMVNVGITSDETKECMNRISHEWFIYQKRDTIEDINVCECNGRKVELKLTHLNHPTREFIVLVKRIGDGDDKRLLSKMYLNINGQNIGEDLDISTCNKIIPKMYYNIDNKDSNMYIINFDRTPKDVLHNGSLNLSRIDISSRLVLEFNKSGKYEIVIISRCMNILRGISNMFGLAYAS